MKRPALLPTILLVTAFSSFSLAQQNTWTLDNGIVRKTLTFTREHGLEVESWSDLSSGHEFLRPEFQHRGFNEFQFTADGKNVSGKPTDVALVNSHNTTADRSEHPPAEGDLHHRGCFYPVLQARNRCRSALAHPQLRP